MPLAQSLSGRVIFWRKCCVLTVLAGTGHVLLVSHFYVRSLQFLTVECVALIPGLFASFLRWYHFALSFYMLLLFCNVPISFVFSFVFSFVLDFIRSFLCLGVDLHTHRPTWPFAILNNTSDSILTSSASTIYKPVLHRRRRLPATPLETRLDITPQWTWHPTIPPCTSILTTIERVNATFN